MRTRTGQGVAIALFLAFAILCSGSLLAQDKLLTSSYFNASIGNSKLADATAVDCSAYAADGTTCVAGQYYHSDNVLPNGTWNATATSTAYGSWIEGNGSSSGCLSCHHGSITTAGRGGGYLIGGHKNILRKVVPGENLLDVLGNSVTNVIDHSSNPYTLNQSTGLLSNGANAYYLAGWLANGSIDVFGGPSSTLAYGSCARCHTTGYRFDGVGPEPTAVTGTYNANNKTVGGGAGFTFTPITSAQMGRVPAGGASGTTSSWYLTGIQCERCHKADMQYDATVVNPNVGTTAAPLSSNGRISHLNNIIPTSVTANASTGVITGTDFYISAATTSTAGTRPLPNPPYALTCVECHQNYATWTATTAGKVGQVHLTPLPGFEALAPALPATGYTNAGKALTGQYTATFACSVASITTASHPGTYYNDCITAGGTVTYVPGGMSHGVVATFLNSPHARVTGYVDTKNPGTPDSTLTIIGGTANVNVGGTITSVNVPTGYNTHFASAGTADQGAPAGVTGATNGVAGSCAGCHNIHGDMQGYFNPAVNATNVQSSTLITCGSCHQDGSRYAIASPSHSQGTGTPSGITAANGTTTLESCAVCHMAGASGTGTYHFLRINSDVNYNTFPSAATYYTTYGSGQLAPFNTYASTWNGSTETYKDGNGTTQNYPAVALDVDLACGQCHTGGDGTKNPYGLTPTGAPVFTRATLASYAKGIHNTVATAALTPTFSAAGTTYPASSAPLSVTISEAIANASICYTTDGTTPVYVDAGAAIYAENVIPSCSNGTLAVSGVAVSISKNTTLKALAAGANTAGQPLTASAVNSATYNFQATAPALTGGSFTSQQTVTLTGATQYCTVIAGSSCTPTTAVAGPLTISVPTTVRAINAPTGFTASAITSATFNIVPSAPVFSATGTVTKGTSVTITGPAGSTIYYVIGTATPTTSSLSGTAGSGTATVTIAASEYVRAIAVYTSGSQTAKSSVTTATFTAK